MTGEKIICGLTAQSANCVADIGRHRAYCRLRNRSSTEHVTGEGSSKCRIIAGEACFIGYDATIESARHALHVRADTQVTDPHLAQRAVEVGEHCVEEALTEPARLGSIVLEAMKIQKCMQANQFKTPVQRVRHAIIDEEHRLAGLFDDTAICAVYRLTGRIASG